MTTAVQSQSPVVQATQPKQKVQKKKAVTAEVTQEHQHVTHIVNCTADDEPVITTPEPVVEETFEKQLELYFESVNKIQKAVKDLNDMGKSLKVLYKLERKSNKKKKTVSDKTKQTHGFTKETYISDNLSKFLGLEIGAPVRRPHITHLLAKYINEHKCYHISKDAEGNEVVKRDIIVPNKALKAILGEPTILNNKKNPSSGFGYNYKNLQTYFKRQNIFRTEPVQP